MGDWDPQANEIFLQAAEIASREEQAAYLDAACGPDLALRARVDRLLAAHTAPDNLLDIPVPGLTDVAGATDVRAVESEASGQRIGAYTLLQKLGEGGMGSVWAAEQNAPVKRRVALKLIKPGMDSQQVLRRFEAERQALALMDHPNIAKVFDAGTTSAGRPYFAMELVKGVSITKYCDELNLSVRERLHLSVSVCRAIQHAHMKGVVHRDIKPSNVLVAVVDGQAAPKVIDFGVAKALHQRLTERTVYTEIGGVIGTLEYMAPEQAELSALDVDTRADVYALGVLLYELLTGTTPLDRKRLASAGLAELVRIIREEEPRRPSTRLSESGESLPELAAHRRTEPSRLTREVRGDLDWIVMKCLEKDRARRYETANGLARDIERHLADEPVEARPPSRGYRLRKLARRNKGLLAAAALVLLALLGGIAAATWQAVRATNAETLADERFKNERDARKDAEAARKRAETEAAKASAIADLLEDVLSSADPNKAKGAEYTLRQLLDDAAGRLRDRLDAPLEVEAAVRAAIGTAYRRLTLTDQAEPHLRRALAIRRTAPGPREELLAQSLLDYGWNLYESRRYADAEPYAREAVEVYERHGTRNVDTLKALAALHISLDAQRRDDEAEAVANDAIALGRELFPQGHAELASVLHRLASAKRVLGDAAAEPLAVEAVAMHERWHGKNHPETGWGLLVLGDVEFTQRRFSEAEAHYRRCRKIFEDSYGGSHAFTKSAQERLESVVETSGDPDALAALRQEKASRLQAALGEGTADTPDGALRLAEIYFGAGLWDEARDQLHAAAAVSEPDAETTQRLAEANRRFADAFKRREGQNADELAARAEEVRWRERLVGHDPTSGHRVELADAHARHGDAYLRAGLPDDAVEPFVAATGLWTELSREDPENRRYRQERARLGHQLADALVETGRVGEAVSQAETAVQLYEQLGAEPDAGADYRDLVIRARLTLVRALAAADRDATDAFEALLRLWKPEPKDLNEFAWGLVSDGPVPRQQARLAVLAAERAVAATPDDGKILNTLGVARYRAGDWRGAVDALSTSDRMLGDRFFGHNAFFLAVATFQAGETERARQWYDRAVAWSEANAPDDSSLRAFRWEAEELLGVFALPGGAARLPGRSAASWSHDGSRIVATFGGLRLVDLATGEQTRLTDGGADAAWRPLPGGAVAYGWKRSIDDEEQVWLIGTDGKGRQRIGPGGYPGWSGDGRVLYFGSRPPGFVLAVDVDETGVPVMTPRVVLRNCPTFFPAVSPDGTRVAYHDGAALSVVEIATGHEVRRWPAPGWRNVLPAWSPDGRYVAFGEFGWDRDLGLWVLDTTCGRAVLAIEGPATKPVWSPDGRRLAFDLRRPGGSDVLIVETDSILERLNRVGPPPPVVAERPRSAARAPTAREPFSGHAAILPGIVQAEDFDEGGEGVAYHDRTGQDTGGQARTPRYRVTTVDIDDCKDAGGGFNIGGVHEGEWLAYTVDVSEAGDYELSLRLSSPEGGGRVRLEFDGKDVGGVMPVPRTGSWNDWTTVAAGRARLQPGRQVMRVVLDVAGSSGHVCNLNWVEARRSP